ncbi:hypothetical protein GCM10022254_00700 [Actinomadura meridiana]|uniref:RDD domain-containing protein n=1 Tax=Actinomadura meridiana TaxID=559626 RepID=A0ABP8BRB8_9ACTN
MTEAPLAEPGQRLLARIIDTLIVGVPVIVVVRAVVAAHAVDVVAPPAVAGCMLLYESIQLALWGRTLGKRVAGIEVVVGVPGANSVTDSAIAVTRDGEAAELAPPSSWTSDADAGSAAATAPPTADSDEKQEPDAGPVEGASTRNVFVDDQAPLDVGRAVLRAAIYSLPIAARPIPVAGLLASLFWVANAGAMYEGTNRQAVHDRIAGTLVVKRPPTDSSAF